MEKLPKEDLEEFLKGNHVMRHKGGIWNEIWSDMFIESTFMRYGHGPGGIVGITLQPSALKRWAYSLHICSKLIKDVAHMSEDDHKDQSVMFHKEEMSSCRVADAEDRQKLRDKLQTCIDPLETNEPKGGIVNIVTGKIAPKSMNIDQIVTVGKEQAQQFKPSGQMASTIHLPRKS